MCILLSFDISVCTAIFLISEFLRVLNRETRMAPPSNIWKHFTKLNNSLALCNICRKTLKTSGNTSNLHNHLKTHGKTKKKINAYLNKADIDDSAPAVNVSIIIYLIS